MLKTPSLKTCELIDGLQASQSFWQRLFGEHEPPVWALDEIARSDEVLAIPKLAPLLFHERSDVRDGAARAIGALIRKVTPLEFAQLDEACRKSWMYAPLNSSAWLRLQPKDVKALWHLDSAIYLIGIASFHPNGFVREAAVNEVANSFDGPELPFLLLRLNDWVQTVRECAANAVRRRLCTHYARHFLTHWRLVSRLQSCGRTQHEGVIRQIEALLSDPSAAPLLREGIQSADPWSRRECFRLAIAGDAAQRPALVRELLASPDAFLRLWATRYVLPRVSDDELKPVLPALARDRFMAVRCEALNLLARRLPREASPALTDALVDTHVSVRAVARHWIRAEQPHFDFASRYRGGMGDRLSAVQRAAILGLGETGAPADAESIAPFLQSPLVSMRKAAIRSLAALNVDAHLEQLVRLLADEHPGISNEARRALVRRATTVIDKIQPFFDQASRLHIRKNAFKLLARQPFWSRGAFLMKALRDADPAIASLARSATRVWMSRSGSMGTPPTTAEMRDLREQLSASAMALTAKELREFEFCFCTYHN